MQKAFFFSDYVVIFQDTSWINMKSEINETFSVFTTNYHLSKVERTVVEAGIKEKQGFSLKKSSNDKNLWISNDDVSVMDKSWWTILNIYTLYIEAHFGIKTVS